MLNFVVMIKMINVNVACVMMKCFGTYFNFELHYFQVNIASDTKRQVVEHHICIDWRTHLVV